MSFLNTVRLKSKEELEFRKSIFQKYKFSCICLHIPYSTFEYFLYKLN